MLLSDRKDVVNSSHRLRLSMASWDLTPTPNRSDDLRSSSSASPPLQFELLPLLPSLKALPPSPPDVCADKFPQVAAVASSSHGQFWPPRANGSGAQTPRGIDVNQIPSFSEGEEVVDFPGLQRGGSVRLLDYVGVGTKREREKASDADQERTCEVSSRASDEDEGAGTRKKLRLSKEQSALLEESFKEHSTLNPKQKNALAKQLSLRPRQVEVWFQNRRARTKLKQTEVDCELLKRCCESLTEENRRLHKELQELRAVKMPAPCVIAHDFYMPMPAATLTMCPSCERLASMDNRSLGFAKPQLPHFQQPSAAC